MANPISFLARTIVPALLLPTFLLGGIARAETIPEGMDAVVSQSTVIGNDWSILFEDDEGNSVYYSRSPDRALIPASNMKMFTTAAALELLGADYVFETHVYYTGSLSGSAPNQTVSGNIVLVVEHDPTWNSSTLSNVRAGLNNIASRIRNQAGISTVNGTVEIRGAAAYGLGGTNTNHQNFTANQSARNKEAADALLAALQSAGVTVNNTSTIGNYTFNLPPGATQLFTYQSDAVNYFFNGAPLNLGTIIRPLNKVSHNPMADLMLRHLGWKLGPGSPPADTYTQGAAVVREWLENEVNIDTTGLVLSDGSGLAASSRISARQTVELTRYMVNKSTLWRDSLPISGVSGANGGTMSSRLGGTLQGRVYAKTGTLPGTGVVSLSGFVNHPFNGRRYYFSIYTNNTSGINVNASRSAIDDVVREIGLVWPPIAPDLYSINNTASGVRIQWTDNALEGDGYRLYASDNGGASYTLLHETAPGEYYIIESGNVGNSNGLNNGDYSDTGGFENSTSHSVAPGLTPGVGSRFIRPDVTGTATFTPSALPEGRYRVDVTCFNFSSANAANTTVTIVDRVGTQDAFMDLGQETAGSRWRTVGNFDFVPGENHRVEFSNANQLTTDVNDRLNPAAVRFVPLHHDDTGLVDDDQRVYKVVSMGPAGTDSEDSNAWAARRASTPPILVIDNFNRWKTQNINLDASNNNFAALTAESIPFAHDTVSDRAVEEGHVLLGDYDALVWMFGTEGSVERTFNSVLQPLVIDYLAGGGHLLVSGAEIGWDLARTAASESDKQFFENVLRAARFTAGNPEDDAGTNMASGAPGNIFEDITSFNFANSVSGPYAVNFPDVLNPINGSVAALTYVGGSGGPAAITYDPGDATGKLVFLGFPFEAILSAAVRDEIMEASLNFFEISPTRVPNWFMLLY